MANIQVETASASYRVSIGQGLLQSLLPRIHRALGRKPQRIFVLTSPVIWALWSKKFLSSFDREFPPTILFLLPGETHKNLRSVDALVPQLVKGVEAFKYCLALLLPALYRSVARLIHDHI